MSIAILATKLHIPPPRHKIILRPHLVERLNESLQHRLTLISAPAGFGKTTLLSEWVASLPSSPPSYLGTGLPSAGLPRGTKEGSEVRIAWLSLDEGDSDPVRFLMYLVSALQSIAPHLGTGLLAALQSPMPPPAEATLTVLINEITSLTGDFILILDDYHVIDAQPVDAALAFLLEHLPSHMHLVLATREDPQLPLARLRARGHMGELRSADLRFTLSDVEKFLNLVMGLDLSASDIAALETRTEGWIAGLQLAALSMQGLQDPAGFIQSFTGSHRFVMDYLLEEILSQQPESIQNFLLYTSILERLCGPLCDAVLLAPSTASQVTLEYLERANLFIVPLDDERRWYRYHQLFAELLRARLVLLPSDQLTELHRRASDWYANNDLPNEAVTHAIAVQDWLRAAELIERYSDQWPMRGEINTLLGWLESFPSEFRLNRVSLGVNYAWALFMSHQLERAEAHLNQLLPGALTTSLLGELFVIRVMIAAYRNDMPAVIDLAQQALAQLPAEEISPRSRLWLTLGVALYDVGGDIAAARSAFRQAYELSQASTSVSSVGNAPLPLMALAYLSEIEWLLGNLQLASQMYDQALVLAEQWGGGPSIALCFVQWGKAGLLYEWNDLEGARRLLQESIRTGELWRSSRLLVDPFGSLALVLHRQGQVDEARVMILRAEQIARESHSTPFTLDSLASYQIALWIEQNDFHAIQNWEQQHASGWQSHTGQARLHLAVVLARASLLRYFRQPDQSALRQAQAIIRPALEQAQSSGLNFHIVRLLILDALALYAMGETTATFTTLQHLLALAEPQNYIRSFVDLGAPLRELLSRGLENQALSEPHLRAYAHRLLSSFAAESPDRPVQPLSEGLIEPLTERELGVLRLIAEGHSNRQIGERLFLTLNTVKGHNQNIFNKLQVHRRTEAVLRARQLGLL